MRKIPYAVVLVLFAASLSGCSGTDDGPSAYLDEVHIYVDGSFSDETLCQEALVLSSGEYYGCSFTLTADAWLGIELDVASGSPSVDLITMSDLNFQKWEDLPATCALNMMAGCWELSASFHKYGDICGEPDGVEFAKKKSALSRHHPSG